MTFRKHINRKGIKPDTTSGGVARCPWQQPQQRFEPWRVLRQREQWSLELERQQLACAALPSKKAKAPFRPGSKPETPHNAYGKRANRNAVKQVHETVVSSAEASKRASTKQENE